MAALARILLEANFEVSGSDLELNDRCRKLQQLGAKIAPAGHRMENLPPRLDGVIISSAISMDNPEVCAALKQEIMVWRRGEFLGEVARCYKRRVAVAGAHGKSSTSAMLSWVLLQHNQDIGMMIGAEYSSNIPNARLGDGDIFVTEADESDLSFVELSGTLGLITNISDDHAWDDRAKRLLIDSFICFGSSFRNIIYVSAPVTDALMADKSHCRGLGETELAYYQQFLPGWMCGFERLNGALVLAAAEHLGIAPEAAGAALMSYPGLQRRLSERLLTADGQTLVVEDYAHHPTELRASLSTLKERYPGRRLIAVFQPHRYARLQAYFDQFAEILSEGADQIYIPPVFAAWNEIGTVNNVSLADAVNQRRKCAQAVDGDYEALGRTVAADARRSSQGTLVAVIGAGDVNKILKSLKEHLSSSKN